MRPQPAPDAADPAAAAAHGTMLLAGGDYGAALPWLRRAVAGGEQRPEIWLNRALAEQQAGDPARALSIMQAIEAQQPDWSEPPLRLAEYWRAQGDAAQAEAAYQRALGCDPARPEVLLGLAVLLLQRGAAERAQTLLLRCCAAAPQSWQAWDALSIASLATGDPAAAYAAGGRAHALAPALAPLALRFAEAAIAADRPELALASLEAENEADPLNAAALAGAGVLLAQLGRAEQAAAVLETACALAPADAAIAAAAARALLRCGPPEAAVPALRRALDLNPSDATLRNNYAASLTRIHRTREARDELRALIAAQGETAEALCNLAAAEVSLGEQTRGAAAARRATELAPRSHLAWRTLANAQAYAADADGAALLETLRRAGAVAPRGRLPPFVARAPRPGERLRVGLLGATLRTHPVGWLTLAGIENLDPGAFALVCLAGPDSPDPMQRRFRAAAAEWHVLGPDPAAQARALGLDILIDLGGYGDLGQLAACAERLAPVQVKWVGMQNHSTGLPEMDWFISDRWETPPDLAHLYSERLLLMPDGYACYTPPPYAPDVAPAPCLQNGHVTFGCFNNWAKVTPAVLALWCDILHAVPGSRLVLKTHQFGDAQTAASVRARFAGHAIGADRIDLLGASPHRGLLAAYAQIDLVLDPHPYSGGLTTCEALWMGVPVLTVPGTTFASRHSASHLCNLGLDDWVAADLRAYREQAVARASDPAALAALRLSLRERMRASPLCDGPRFGRHLGAALRRAWNERIAAQPG